MVVLLSFFISKEPSISAPTTIWFALLSRAVFNSAAVFTVTVSAKGYVINVNIAPANVTPVAVTAVATTFPFFAKFFILSRFPSYITKKQTDN